MKTVKQLKQGETERYNTDGNIAHLWFEHGTFFVTIKPLVHAPRLFSFATFKDAKLEFKKQVESLKRIEKATL